MSTFSNPVTIETNNGSATLYMKTIDLDLSHKVASALMGGRAWIDGNNVLEKDTSGMLFKRAEIEWASDEAETNYRADYTV